MSFGKKNPHFNQIIFMWLHMCCGTHFGKIMAPSSIWGGKEANCVIFGTLSLV